MTDAEKLDPSKMSSTPPATLSPLKDGYCLTRSDSKESMGGIDYNLVHCRWQLTYQIAKPDQFFQNMYHRVPGPGANFMDAVAESIHPMLKAMAAEAIVNTLVRTSIDDAIISKEDIRNSVENLLQKKLDTIDSGIKIDSALPLGKITWPRQVNEAFLESNKATQLKIQKIDEARGYASQILNAAGGANADTVLTAMKNPAMTDAQREQYCSELAGTSQELIAQARAYRTKVVEETKASAEYLKSLLPEYQKRPQLVVQKIYQDAIEEIMQSAQEKMVIQSPSDKAKELRILINRDPSIGKKATTTPQSPQAGRN
jgi:regulator of protease activity HflC (stomatin/prohibitin superfamily)